MPVTVTFSCSTEAEWSVVHCVTYVSGINVNVTHCFPYYVVTFISAIFDSAVMKIKFSHKPGDRTKAGQKSTVSLVC